MPKTKNVAVILSWYVITWHINLEEVMSKLVIVLSGFLLPLAAKAASVDAILVEHAGYQSKAEFVEDLVDLCFEGVNPRTKEVQAENLRDHLGRTDNNVIARNENSSSSYLRDKAETYPFSVKPAGDFFRCLFNLEDGLALYVEVD